MTNWLNPIGKVLGRTLLLINIVVVVWLFLCYSSSKVHPAHVKYIALFSLTTPFAVFGNIAFAVMWLFSAGKWRSLFSIVALGVCYQLVPAVFGAHYFSSNDWSKSPGGFKLMSWNVHGMGLFNPPHEEATAVDIIDLIHRENPDILCLPEFTVHLGKKRRSYSSEIIKKNGYKKFLFNSDNAFGPSIVIGTAIYSRIPVLDYKVFTLSPEIYMLQCDVKASNDRIIRLCVLHLQSFGLSDHDKAFIEEVKNRNTEDLSKSKSYAWKFNQAYLVRAQEADKAAEVIRQSPYPVIVCGDFNDLPFSYTYTKIKGPLTDAFVKKGRGFGRTYNQIIPTLRIDHILFDASALNIKAFKTVYSALSDHSPVFANFEIKSNAEE